MWSQRALQNKIINNQYNQLKFQCHSLNKKKNVTQQLWKRETLFGNIMEKKQHFFHF